MQTKVSHIDVVNSHGNDLACYLITLYINTLICAQSLFMGALRPHFKTVLAGLAMLQSLPGRISQLIQ